MVSLSVPTPSSTLTGAVKLPSSRMPARRIGLKPASVNVTSYRPGLRSMMRYCPAPSVMTLRTRSMSAGLVASTVTPGSVAPVVSRTTPAMAACARAADGSTNVATDAATRLKRRRRMDPPSTANRDADDFQDRATDERGPMLRLAAASGNPAFRGYTRAVVSGPSRSLDDAAHTRMVDLPWRRRHRNGASGRRSGRLDRASRRAHLLQGRRAGALQPMRRMSSARVDGADVTPDL